MSCRTLCEVPDLSALLRPPTAPHLAAFILPSRGRVPSSPWPDDQTCDNPRIPRRRTERLIMASARMISAQTDHRLVICLLLALQLQDLANAARLQLDRRFAPRPMCCPALVTSRETMRWTSRARDRRVLTLADSAQHERRALVCRTQCRLRQNTHPSEGQSSGRCPFRRSLVRHPRTSCLGDPTSRGKPRSRN